MKTYTFAVFRGGKYAHWQDPRANLDRTIRARSLKRAVAMYVESGPGVLIDDVVYVWHGGRQVGRYLVVPEGLR